jgi:hypothetical protein
MTVLLNFPTAQSAFSGKAISSHSFIMKLEALDSTREDAASSYICHLPFAICHLPFAICPLPLKFHCTDLTPHSLIGKVLTQPLR